MAWRHSTAAPPATCFGAGVPSLDAGGVAAMERAWVQ